MYNAVAARLAGWMLHCVIFLPAAQGSKVRFDCFAPGWDDHAAD